ALPLLGIAQSPNRRLRGLNVGTDRDSTHGMSVVVRADLGQDYDLTDVPNGLWAPSRWIPCHPAGDCRPTTPCRAHGFTIEVLGQVATNRPVIERVVQCEPQTAASRKGLHSPLDRSVSPGQRCTELQWVRPGRYRRLYVGRLEAEGGDASVENADKTSC